MLALLVLSAALAVQTLPIAEVMEDLALESTEDLTRLAETRSQSEHLLYYQIPVASEYSINNAAYALGRGSMIDTEDFTTDRYDNYEILERQWRDEAAERLEDRTSEELGCATAQELDIRFYPELSDSDKFDTDLESTVFRAQPSRSRADGGSIDVRCEDPLVSFTESDYSHQSEIEDNRYSELLKHASEFFAVVNEEAEDSDIEEEYEGEGEACGSTGEAYDNALDDAESDYNSDTVSASDMASNIDLADDMEKNVDQDDDFDELSEDPHKGDCCNFGECEDYDSETGECLSRECEDYNKNNTVIIKPTNTQINLELEDTLHELLIEGEYQNLELNIRGYELDY